MTLRTPVRWMIAVALIATVAACTRYTAIQPQRVTVKNALSVEPGQAWNRINQAGFASHPTEFWTADGDQLNMLMFFVGIADGQSLLPQRDDAETKLPVFRSAMTPNEIQQLVESTLGTYLQSPLVEGRNLRPSPFGDQNGYRFELTLVGKDEVDRQGLASGTVRDGKLYLVIFTGTRLHHYGLRVQDAERIVGTLRFAA